MFNMVKLDWSAMKYYRSRIIILPLYLLLIGWLSPICLVPMGTILMFAYSINPFAVEEKGDLNRLYLSLPVRRSTIVAGRYSLSFLMVLLGMVSGFVLMPLANLVSHSKWYPDLRWSLALFTFCLLLFGLMSLAMHPLLFWLGYQKGKFWGFYLPGIFFAMAFVLLMECDYFLADGKLITRMLIAASEHAFLVCGGMLLLGLALLMVSFLLSLKVYSKKEF